MELSRNDTKMMQALSVLAMVCLHLFDRWDYEGLYTPLLYFRGIPLSFYLAQLSDFCVMGFAFCSGYGHAMQYARNADRKAQYRHRLRGVLQLYVNYWVVVLAFGLLSVLMGQGDRMPGSVRDLLLNFTGLETTYNGACWYVFTYAVIVAASPLLLDFGMKRNLLLSAGASAAMYIVSFAVRFKLGSENWFLQQFGKFGMTAAEYMIGVYCVRLAVFPRLRCLSQKCGKAVRGCAAAAIFLALLYARTSVIPSTFFAPASGAVLLAVFAVLRKPVWLEKALLFIGGHSTNIWLTHMFFYAVLFKNLVFCAKYPILIMGLMLALTIFSSYVIGFAAGPAIKAINRKLDGYRRAI